MAELDRFDARLEAAVRAFADRVRTEVDAVEVATRSAHGRRTGPSSWLERTVTIPVALLLLLGLLVLVTMSLAAGGWWPFRSSFVPSVAASPVAAVPTPSPTAPGTAATDGQGPEQFSGTESVSLTTGYTSTVVDGVTQLRGGAVSVKTSTNDERVNGTGTFVFSVDVYADAGVEWGTYHLETADGAWDGPCRGATWQGGDAAVGSCWLVGSGAYAGYTYHRGYSWIPGDVWVEGIIFPGSPPGP